MKDSIVVPIVVAVIVGAGGFYGGIKYQESKIQTGVQDQLEPSNQGRGERNGQMVLKGKGGTNTRMAFKPVVGEIVSVDENSVTVKLEDGSSKIILLSDKTSINKAETVNKDQLSKGTRVSVFGQEDKDGIVSAQSIQLNPLIQINVEK